jgi:hypothetical protein
MQWLLVIVKEITSIKERSAEISTFYGWIVKPLPIK